MGDEGCGLSVTGEGDTRVETYYSGPPRNEEEAAAWLVRYAEGSSPAPTPQSAAPPACNMLTGHAPWLEVLRCFQWHYIKDSVWIRDIFKFKAPDGYKSPFELSPLECCRHRNRGRDPTDGVTCIACRRPYMTENAERRRLLERLQGY